MAFDPLTIVIPAKAGIQYAAGLSVQPLMSLEYWIIRFRGQPRGHDVFLRSSLRANGSQ